MTCWKRRHYWIDSRRSVFGGPFASVQKNSIAVILHHMKTTLTITSRGIVTLPAKLRQTLGLKADDQLIAESTPEGLLLRPAITLPVEMYSEERVREFDEAEADLGQVLRPAAKVPRTAVTRKPTTKRKR